MSLKNKILLVWPGRYGSLFPELPLSLLYLSWALKKKGFCIEIFDMRLGNFKEIKNKEYLFVGISCKTCPTIRDALNLAKHMKSLNHKIPIVWGGVHVTLLPEQSLMNPYVDIIIRGEGEITIQELADKLKHNEDLSTVKGISYKKNGTLIANPEREFINLNEIDYELPYELFDMDRYLAVDCFPVHTSRGCPHKCAFCYNLAFNQRRTRFKSADRVVNEIEYIHKKYGIKKFTFGVDDEFFVNIKRVRAICEEILTRGLEITWNSFCRFDYFQKIDDEMLQIIERSGCNGLSFGGESGSQRLLDEVVKKDIKIEMIIDTTERLSRSNIQQMVSLMSGLPTETSDDLKMTIKLIDRLKEINPRIFFTGIFLYTPYPGTPLFDFVIKNYGYKAPDSLEKWSVFGIYTDTKINWHSTSYLKKCRAISVLSRFSFWKNKFYLSDIQNILGNERFNHFPLNLIYYLFTKIAIIRWKYKFFMFPVEFTILEKVLLKKRGYV